jgi:hypothetical protein
MGTILSFEPRKPGVPRPPEALSSPPSVVIFPGVRYERYVAPESKSGRLIAKHAKRPAAPPQT